MNFSQACELLLQGRRVRRALWREAAGVYGDYLELVQPPSLPDGRRIHCQLMIWSASSPFVAEEFVPWGGLHVDAVAEDWEVAEP